MTDIKYEEGDADTLLYLKLMQKLDKWITNKQNIRLFSFTVGHKSIVLQDENT